MTAHLEFLPDLALVWSVAAVTTVIFQQLRLPVVLGYLLAGLVIGPHVPVPLLANPDVVHSLAELGVILLMFGIGLEFSVRGLLRVLPTAGLAGVVQLGGMWALGWLSARALGWDAQTSLYAGAALSISSTTIIARAFAGRSVEPAWRDLVLGILIVEDLAAVLLLTVLTGVGAGGGLDLPQFARLTGGLLAFVAGLLIVGLFLVPRVFRSLVRHAEAETLLVASVGLCFALAMLAQSLGYSVALGGFIAGALIAESGEGHAVLELIKPLRDAFAAVFFVAVGMLLDPQAVLDNLGAVALLTSVVILGKLTTATFGAFLSGSGLRTAVLVGASLAQIGEFSFVIAGLGVTLGTVGRQVYPVAVAVSALTTLTTPWLIRSAPTLARAVEHSLPASVRGLAIAYTAWVESLRASSETPAAPARRAWKRMLADEAMLLALTAIGLGLRAPAVGWLVRRQIPLDQAHLLYGLAVLALLVPFVLGLLRSARLLGAPHTPGRIASHRSGLVRAVQWFALTLQIPLVLAITGPFLPWRWAVLALPVSLLLVGLGLWRSAARWQGDLRASSQRLFDALAAQARSHQPPAGPVPRLDDAFAELGAPRAVRIAPDSQADGRTLAELDVRQRTGATVLAIQRQGADLVLPTGQERLRAGDLLAVSGRSDAVRAAETLLTGAASPLPP
jgi:CPA2 family monovalent cation:H+ antiporter-2